MTQHLEASAFGPRAVISDRYRLIRELGVGGVSTVYLADDLAYEQLVAVKVLAPHGSTTASTPERFEAELAALRAVEHPNVVRMLDAGHTRGGEPFVVTEALRGQSLGDWLRERGRMEPAVALRIARQAARGLEAAHRRGVVHRDVKPDNLFLCDQRHHDVWVKLLDFGFASLDEHCESTTGGKHVVGTLEYLAPEQVVADSVDSRSDVYSLGVVLFRALTGELPFDLAARMGLLTHHLMSPVPPPSWLLDDLDPNIEKLVLRATRKHPDNRYATMAAFLNDLDRCLRGEPVFDASLSVEPDAYRPQSEYGERAFETISTLV